MSTAVTTLQMRRASEENQLMYSRIQAKLSNGPLRTISAHVTGKNAPQITPSRNIKRLHTKRKFAGDLSDSQNGVQSTKQSHITHEDTLNIKDTDHQKNLVDEEKISSEAPTLCSVTPSASAYIPWKRQIDETDEEDAETAFLDGIQTPPHGVQGYNKDIPLVKSLDALFLHSDGLATFLLREIDQNLYEEASKWFKSRIQIDTDSTIKEMRKERFHEDWIHDLLYDRLKLLRTGLNPKSDENTYTSFWVAPDFVALQTGVPGLVSSGFINENHYGPSAWRRTLARGCHSAKGTNVDAYYLSRDDYVDIIFENIGPPTCRDHTKHHNDKEKSWRNAADALLERFYNSSGSFEIAKEYKVICVIVFGYEVTLYTVNILDRNAYMVTKILQGTYHMRRDVYLANMLFHLKFCLAIKTIMEDNWDVSVKFGNSIESVPKDQQAHHNLAIHTTPTKSNI
ncbi:hypothetical protein BGX26_010345 [Mortierella sp. AD094]|nr:hypothetical protein BGX26_010345 [Mortierella sp. AD094]